MPKRPSFSFVAAMATALGAAAGVLAMMGSLGSLASCEDGQVYVYSAQKYDPTGACVNGYSSLEIVNGPGAASTCAPICVTVGSATYVSTMCPPLPAIATEAPADGGDCIAALAAMDSGGTCDNPADSGMEKDAESEGGPEGGDGDSGDDGGDADAAKPDAATDAGIKDAADAG